jgi:hypothetical protein
MFKHPDPNCYVVSLMDCKFHAFIQSEWQHSCSSLLKLLRKKGQEHMINLSIISILSVAFTFYPDSNYPDQRIEAITQIGPIYELIVRCGKGSAIISFSPIEELYCSPKGSCDPQLDVIIDRTCG